MVTILAALLCMAIVISAIAAERSAPGATSISRCLPESVRDWLPWRGLGVHLCMVPRRCGRGRQVAMAEMETSPGTLVRLLVDSDQPAEHMPPEQPAVPATQESRGRQADAGEGVEQAALPPPATDNQAIELPVEATEQVPRDQNGLDRAARRDELPGANRLRSATRMG